MRGSVVALGAAFVLRRLSLHNYKEIEDEAL